MGFKGDISWQKVTAVVVHQINRAMEVTGLQPQAISQVEAEAMLLRRKGNHKPEWAC